MKTMTLQEKVERGLGVSQKMIDDREKSLQEEIERGNWAAAAVLEAYIRGMQQIEIVFSQLDLTKNRYISGRS